MQGCWLTFVFKSKKHPDGWTLENISRLIDQINRDPSKEEVWWRCVSYKSTRAGDRFYLFKQGKGRKGIFGFGSIVDTAWRSSYRDPKITARALLKFQLLTDPSGQLIVDISDIEHLGIKNLINARASGNIVSDEICQKIEKLISQKSNEENNDKQFDILDTKKFEDAREKSLRSIHIRQGQKVFRNVLLDAYKHKCAVTDCKLEDLLDAAHITPYLGTDTNIIQNGIILRTDIHTLLDKNLIAINPDTYKLEISSKLSDSDYECFAGRLICLPHEKHKWPSKFALMQAYRKFLR